MRIIGNNPAADNAEITAVASGTLPDGKAVIVNADGTVSVVAETTTSATEALGSATVFDGSGVDFLSSTYDTVNDKFVIVYRDYGNSYFGTAVVGTVSGTSISFGTPVAFHNQQSVSIATTFDPVAGKVVIIFRDTSSSYSSKCVAGTVSGTSISFGTVTQFATDYIGSTNLVYDSNSNKVVALYNTPAAGTYGKAVVLTYSGSNSYTGGTGVVWASASTQAISACFDSDRNQIIIAFTDYSNSQRGTTIVGTVSGTSISFGTESVFENDGTSTADGAIGVAYNSTFSRVILAYAPLNTNYGEIALGTNSGTSVGVFSLQIFNAASTNTFCSVVSDPQANGAVVVYRDNGNSAYGTYRVCTFNGAGTSFTFGSETVYEAASTNTAIRPAIDLDNSKILIAYQDAGNSNAGTGIALQNAYSLTTTNLTAENYIGMSSGAVTTGTSSQALGSAVVFESAQSTQIGSAYDSTNNKVVVAYSDDADSYKGKAVVGTVDTSDNSISFGTPVQFEAGNTEDISAAFDANSGKIVIAFKDSSNSGYGTAIVGTVSGTGISFGSAATFESATSNDINVVYDSTNNKVVIVYVDGGNSSYGTAIVGTVSGTSISFGSAAVFSGSNQAGLIFASFDSTLGKVVVAYQQSENSGYAAVGTVSGTNISFGSPVNFNGGTNNAIRISCAYDSTANRTVIFYRDQSNSSYDTAIVGTVSGTTISFGTKTVVTSQVNNYRAIAHDANAGTNVLAVSSNYNFKVGTVDASDNSMTFSGATTFEGASANWTSALYDSTGKKVVLSYQDSGNSNYGTSTVVSLAAPIIIRAEVASGSNAVIDIGCAISTNQLSLTAGQQYFVQTDGTLGLTAASPSVIAGTAVSATDIIVKG